jgi:hypothetical protein
MPAEILDLRGTPAKAKRDSLLPQAPRHSPGRLGSSWTPLNLGEAGLQQLLTARTERAEESARA